MSRKWKIVRDESNVIKDSQNNLNDEVFKSSKTKKQQEYIDLEDHDLPTDVIYKFTVKSSMMDNIDDAVFLKLNNAINYGSACGFDCEIYRNGIIYGRWSSISGFKLETIG